MQWNLSTDTTMQTIMSYNTKEIRVNTSVFFNSIIITPQSVANFNKTNVELLETADFDQLVELQPEVVLLGTGEKMIFPPPSLYQSLTKAQIGIEVMPSGSCCRTYNLLANDGRRVVAIILVG